MYSKEQLEGKIAQCDTNIQSLQEQAASEQRRLKEAFEVQKQQFEQNMVQLNANANDLIGTEKGKKDAYTEWLNDFLAAQETSPAPSEPSKSVETPSANGNVMQDKV